MNSFHSRTRGRHSASRRRPTARVTLLQQLESRQLLAGDVCVASDYPALQGTAEAESSFRWETLFSEGIADRVEHLAPQILANAQIPAISQFPAIHLRSQMDSRTLDDGEQLIVAQPVWNSQNLPEQVSTEVFIFAEDGDGELIELQSTTLPFSVDRLERVGGSLVAIGSASQATLDSLNATDTQEATSYDRAAGPSRMVLVGLSEDDLSIQFVNPLARYADVVVTTADRIYLSAPDFSRDIEIAPAPFPFQVEVLEVSDGEVETIATGYVPVPLHHAKIVGNDLLLPVQVQSWLTRYPPFVWHGESLDRDRETGPRPLDFPERQTSLSSYSITDGQLTEGSRLELDPDYDYEVAFSDDGLTATMVGNAIQWFHRQAPEGSDESKPDTIVHLIDLSGEAPSIFETIELETSVSRHARHISDESVVFVGDTGEMIVIDANQDIDIAAENRINRFQIVSPDEVPSRRINWQITPVSDEQFLVSAQAFDVDDSRGDYDLSGVGFRLLNDVWNHRPGPWEVRLVSVNDQSASPPLAVESSNLVFLDESSEEPILVELNGRRWSPLAETVFSIVGQTSENQLVLQEAIDIGRPLSVTVSAERLVARYVSAIEIREWDSIDQPQRIELPSPVPPLRAVDDVFEFDGRFARTDIEFLDVLANDQNTGFVVPGGLDLLQIGRARISELIGAPEGVTLSRDGNRIHVGVEAFGDNPFIEFEYVAERNGVRSIASVLVNRVDRIREPENVMELRMSAVDASGNPVRSIMVGDEFFVEVSARDVRRFASGVFAVGFDLPIPADQLELTGEIRVQGDFRDIWRDRAGQSIDEFHAINVLFESPGSAEQEVIRFGARAIGSGAVELQLDAPEAFRSENLVYGSDYVVRSSAVDFGSLDLTILPGESIDTDGNGSLTPSDALRVINFLGRHGNTNVNDLGAIVSAASANTPAGEDLNQSMAMMRRMDANADGSIGIRDALFVINGIARQSALSTSLIHDRMETDEVSRDEIIGQLF